MRVKFSTPAEPSKNPSPFQQHNKSPRRGMGKFTAIAEQDVRNIGACRGKCSGQSVVVCACFAANTSPTATCTHNVPIWYRPHTFVLTPNFFSDTLTFGFFSLKSDNQAPRVILLDLCTGSLQDSSLTDSFPQDSSADQTDERVHPLPPTTTRNIFESQQFRRCRSSIEYSELNLTSPSSRHGKMNPSDSKMF